MEDRRISQMLHILDPSSRMRAELAGIAFELGHHAEVYASFAELAEHRPSAGFVLARDEPAHGGTVRLMRHLADAGLWLPVIATCDTPRPEAIVLAMRAGALDYLALPLDPLRLDNALSRLGVEAGEYGLARRAMIEARDRIAHLSGREREVLDLLAGGHTNKAIARELEISPRTVEIHRANMMGKLGARHAADAVRLKLEAQLEDVPRRRRRA